MDRRESRTVCTWRPEIKGLFLAEKQICRSGSMGWMVCYGEVLHTQPPRIHESYVQKYPSRFHNIFVNRAACRQPSLAARLATTSQASWIWQLLPSEFGMLLLLCTVLDISSIIHSVCSPDGVLDLHLEKDSPGLVLRTRENAISCLRAALQFQIEI